MNRRSFLTTIPAAVAALTASRSRAGATTPVDASRAIVGAHIGSSFDSWLEEAGIREEVDAEVQRRIDEWNYSAFEPFLGSESYPETLRFANVAVPGPPSADWTIPQRTYVAPRGVE